MIKNFCIDLFEKLKYNEEELNSFALILTRLDMNPKYLGLECTCSEENSRLDCWINALKQQSLEKRTLFYTLRQNNSGGYFIKNDDIDNYIIIEASNKLEAESKARLITKPYSEFCECCGERWDYNLDEGADRPSIYGEDLLEVDIKDKDIIIYYINGRKEKFNSIAKTYKDIY